VDKVNKNSKLPSSINDVKGKNFGKSSQINFTKVKFCLKFLWNAFLEAKLLILSSKGSAKQIIFHVVIGFFHFIKSVVFYSNRSSP